MVFFSEFFHLSKELATTVGVYIKLGAMSEDFSTPNPICTSTALLNYTILSRG